ncbi:Outer membrane protein [Minicystis rosea]|nr:Outer membrane protein [Minicystis rosea]
MLGARRFVSLATVAIPLWASSAHAQEQEQATPQGPPPSLVGPVSAEPPPPITPPSLVGPLPGPSPAVEPATPSTQPATPAHAPSLLPAGWKPSFTIGGYVEAAYSYSFEKPSNGIINQRGFDNRHNTFTLQNAVIDAQGKLGGLAARIALQVGQTPDTYYQAEPFKPGTNGGPGASSAATWRFIQQAYAGYKFGVARGLAVEAGIFLSPVGLESVQAKEDWNQSRSTLFFALPFYHTGVRLTLDVTERTSFMLMITNGANSVADNNAGKSVISQYQYKIPDHLILSLLYMGGPERDTGASEGQPWRHLLDGYLSGQANDWLSLALQWDGAFERNSYGISYFGGIAGYARIHPVSWLYLAARGDFMGEHQGTGPYGTARAMFAPARWVGSGTFTVDARPHDHVSFRVEYRHDQAADPIYFRGQVRGDGTTSPFMPNAIAQNTITAAALAWF